MLREQTLKKVDHEYLQIASNKIKAECQAVLSTYQTEQGMLRKQRDDKFEERLQKVETSSERSQDEAVFLRD